MALLRSKPPNPPQNPPKPEDKIATLEDRIDALRNEIDDEIDRRAAALKETMPGVPVLVVRNILTRNSDCQCAAFLRMDAET